MLRKLWEYFWVWWLLWKHTPHTASVWGAWHIFALFVLGSNFFLHETRPAIRDQESRGRGFSYCFPSVLATLVCCKFGLVLRKNGLSTEVHQKTTGLSWSSTLYHHLRMKTAVFWEQPNLFGQHLNVSKTHRHGGSLTIEDVLCAAPEGIVQALQPACLFESQCKTHPDLQYVYIRLWDKHTQGMKKFLTLTWY